MNKAAQKRLTLMGLIIVVVAILLFVVLGSGGAATALSVAQAASGDYDGKKVQVSGEVVADSFEPQGSRAVFTISSADDPSATLRVAYGGAMPATFGNGVTTICTGRIEGALLECSELVTKCPSKYESAEGALTVAMLMDHAEAYVDNEVKVAGYVTHGTLADGTADVRFVLNSQDRTVDVVYDGILPDGIAGGSAVVLTGALDGSGAFVATDVALDADVEAQAA